MTTRKTKPIFESMIELPTLQLAPVTIEQKAPARDARARQAQVPANPSLPARGKITLH